MIRKNFSHVSSSTPKSSNGSHHVATNAILDSPRFQYTGLVPITPMPKFTEMDTPEIRKQAQRYGIKKTLGKAKLRTKLKEVYQYSHQTSSAVDGTENEYSERSRSPGKETSNKESQVLGQDSSIIRNQCQTSRAQAQSEVFTTENKLTDTPKKSSNRKRIDGSGPKSKSNSKGNSKGWMLSPSPEREDSVVSSDNVQDCPSQSHGEKKRENDVISTNIDDPYVFDYSFGDVSRYSDANLSGVVNMDTVDDSSSSCKAPLRTPSEVVDVCSLNTMQRKECGEVISLLDMSNETSANEINTACPSVRKGDCNDNAGTDFKLADDSFGFNDSMTPALMRTPRQIGDATSVEKFSPNPTNGDEITPKQSACGTSLNSGLFCQLKCTPANATRTCSDSSSPKPSATEIPRGTEIISLLDSSNEDSRLETSGTKSPAIDQCSPTEHSARLLIPTPGFMNRQSGGSCMDKTYESVDMFDALPQRSMTSKVNPPEQNSTYLASQDNLLCKAKSICSSAHEGPQKRTIDRNNDCGSPAIDLTTDDLFSDSELTYEQSCHAVKRKNNRDNSFGANKEDQTSADICRGVNSGVESLDDENFGGLQNIGVDTLDDECSSQEDVGSDHEELHRSLFTSYHQDPMSSSSEDEEECKSLMQRLLEKQKANKKELELKPTTMFSGDSQSSDYCFQNNSQDGTMTSLQNNPNFASLVGVKVRMATDSPVKKQRKVEFFNSEPLALTLETTEKPQKPKKSKSKKPKLGKNELEKEMCKAIRSDTALHLSILQYKPIYLSRFKRLMDENDLKVKAADLLDFLDNRGITFSTADENKHKGPRMRKKKGGK